MNISDQVLKLLNGNETGEMNLYTIARELELNTGAIRRVLNSLLKSNMVEMTILCPSCGSRIEQNLERKYSIKIVLQR